MEKQLRITEPYREQYTLHTDSMIKTVNASMNTKTSIRWDFSVERITTSGFVCKLILVEYVIVETDHPIVNEIAEVTNAFSRMLSELHLELNFQGQIQQILNIDTIKDKWHKTKVSMQEAARNSKELNNVLKINDDLYNNPEMLKKAIEASEFFMLHFGLIYGKDFPIIKNNFTRVNFFNSAKLQWNLVAETSRELPADSDFITVTSTYSPLMLSDIAFIRRAYGQFSDRMDISKLSPELKEKGQYSLNPKTGKILEIVINREEVAHPAQLFFKIKYHMMSEKIYLENTGIKKVPAHEKTTKRRFFLEEK